MAQEELLIYGKITNEDGKPIPQVTVTVEGLTIGTFTNEKGDYQLYIPNADNILIFQRLGYETKKLLLSKIHLPPHVKLNPIQANGTLVRKYEEVKAIDVVDRMNRSTTLTRINPKTITKLPDASMSGVEALVKISAGVSSRNELSSQYSVRGGNFDENLVYVNDVEIYRPFLIRSGRQEGLSFVNADLVSSISFSTGGFEAKYGDKMSSVLDIKYKKPSEFKASFSSSLLGATAHVEGLSKNSRFRYLAGFRYKTSKYMLNSLETKGDYFPTFFDVQSYLTYDINEKWELSFLGNYGVNNYKFIPSTSKTKTGTFQNAVKLNIYFEGQEVDRFITQTGAFALNFKPNKDCGLKLTASMFQSIEAETFDILGEYYLNKLDQQLGANQGDSTLNLGIGSYLDHARNFLQARIVNLSHKGYFARGNNHLSWGMKYQIEDIDDEINEWMLMDSAGYSIPRNKHEIVLCEHLNAENTMNSTRLSAYFQDAYAFNTSGSEITLNGGVRFSYWNFNDEFLLSPRASISLKPIAWKRNVLFRFATGVYYQSPFFKETRNLNGVLNRDIKSQKSIHFVLANDFEFHAWGGRTFKLLTELYYKKLSNLIPYKVDNVQIRYYADDIADGYAAGIDVKIDGDFVKGAKSWASLSIMKTEEDIQGDGEGYIPRPSDQRVNVGLFFQDYLPNNDSYKMHIKFLFGTGLPYGPPNRERKFATATMPSYKRVDLGLSKEIIKEESWKNKTGILKYFKSMWLGLEVFNLLGVNNTISYLWVTVVPNSTLAYNDAYHQYAVPNRLTARRINLKLVSRF